MLPLPVQMDPLGERLLIKPDEEKQVRESLQHAAFRPGFAVASCLANIRTLFHWCPNSLDGWGALGSLHAPHQQW